MRTVKKRPFTKLGKPHKKWTVAEIGALSAIMHRHTRKCFTCWSANECGANGSFRMCRGPHSRLSLPPKWERDYQILTCSDTFLLVGLTRAWLYKMNDIDTYLTFIIYVHLVYDIPNHCAHYHCIGLVTFLLNTTRIPMTPVPWILNSLLLHLMLSHKLTMTWWEIKAEIIPCTTDFAN